MDASTPKVRQADFSRVKVVNLGVSLLGKSVEKSAVKECGSINRIEESDCNERCLEKNVEVGGNKKWRSKVREGKAPNQCPQGFQHKVNVYHLHLVLERH